ncbi:DNA polymerase [Streptomyces sp. NBC_00237]|uniref:DNA polymerase n=1 Tax=Streptomyces sp. NBC_00237 TaxID=2975687 RepID=UPI0022514337|nr:DNA polymerase [Streptomyces sp. NBC_00237]MCX5201510.1 DNA polymerase [Streptomyces sp. NBC_00237]
MREILYRLRGQPIRINVVECPDDLKAFEDFVRRFPVLGFDTETTGLDYWNARGDRGFRLRLAQFGTGAESYVIPVELGPEYGAAVVRALRAAESLIAQNATYDLHVVEECLGIPMEDLAPKTWDTKLLAHLVDPRATREGGPGLSLEDLVRFYIDPVAADEVKGSARELAQEYKTTKAEIWKVVSLQDPKYLLYAGMDPVWAYRLWQILYRLVPARSKASGLIGWEHRLAHVCAKLERTGYLLDVEYAERCCAELTAQQEEAAYTALSYGVSKVGSTDQLVEAFTRLGYGYRLGKKTAKGNVSVDDSVLQSIDHPLAQAVIDAKRAGKFRKTWFENALNGRDSLDRVHASLNSLAARTARMTITGSVPAQTFPAGSGFVRGMFLAEEGHVTASIDYSAQELRVAAALSRDSRMIAAFRNAEDLHQLTADAAGVSRKVGKMANFLTCYGGGPKALAQQASIPLEDAKRVIAGFNSTFPGVPKRAEQEADFARREGYIWSATGRRIPVDRGREYAAINYLIQSSARDVTARALLELDKAGFTSFVRLPIHDEAVFSFPEKEAPEMAREAGKIMEMELPGVRITTDIKVGGRSWGSLYLAA